MLQSDDVSTGEISRNLKDLKESVTKLTEAMEDRPDWSDLKRTEATFTAQLLSAEASLAQRLQAEVALRTLERQVADTAIAALQDWNKWAVRCAGGAVILAAAGWVLGGGLLV